MSDQPQDQWREKARSLLREHWNADATPEQEVEWLAQALADAAAAGRESVAKYLIEQCSEYQEPNTWHEAHVNAFEISAAAIRAGRVKP